MRRRPVRNDSTLTPFVHVPENAKYLARGGLRPGQRAIGRGVLLAILTIWVSAPCAPAQAAPAQQSGAQATGSNPQDYSDVLKYIASGWHTLRRSMTECKSVVDPKVVERPVLYLPADLREPPAVADLQSKCDVDVRRLPKVIHHVGDVDGSTLKPGLLYLPNPYVVPGGMFNEMYGWDSYFIIRGLLRDDDLEMARNMVENFFFEIEHYGDFLNANRTYHLDRSQPPFLSSMVRVVYDAEKAQGHDDRAWLDRAYPYVLKDYEFWTSGAHLAGTTGLSRYYDFGEGPAQELGPDIVPYYRRVAGYFLLHPETADGFLLSSTAASPTESPIGPGYDVQVCSNQNAPTENAEAGCATLEDLHLSRDFYKGDRAMRESGYDISFRFGPFGAATHHYAAVDLNSLLFNTERDLAWISSELGHADRAAEWESKADHRRGLMDRYFWDAKEGLYFDYDFEKGQQSTYVYVTTFYPLWVGAASPAQAQAVAGRFRTFDEPGGLVTSRRDTEAQWDYPYGWAPDQLIGVDGLRRYGFAGDANQVAGQFVSMVAQNFRRDGTIKEKYNVVTRSDEVHVTVGYSGNQVGFGWTNGVFLVLLDELRAARGSAGH
jgi:alpha,alpha-trehalase